jgi:hypothetical protein
MSNIPELSQHQRDLMIMGKCPFCERTIKDWKPVVGSFAPEFYATCYDHGIDPSTGHKEDCPYKDIKL